MNWIRIDVGIMDDPSVGALAGALGVSVPLTTGHLVGVLRKLPTHAKDGDLSRIPASTIELWAMWAGKKGKFAAAFRAHLCTAQEVVRGWEKHNGAAIREAQRSADRAKEWREERRRTARERRSPPVPNAVRTVLRNETRRDETNYLTTTTDSGSADAAPPPPPLALTRVTTPKATRKPAAYPHFPVELCQSLHGLWVSTFGACDYPRFRKEFGPLFTMAEADRPAEAPTNAELAAALKSYADLAPLGAAARFANVNHAAGCLAAIARTRRELSDDPSRRSDAVMRLIHGRAAA